MVAVGWTRLVVAGLVVGVVGLGVGLKQGDVGRRSLGGSALTTPFFVLMSLN